MTRRAQRAFTLIEILVVMVIIGIVIAGAILSLGSTGRDRELEQERDRLAALIPYIRERASILTLEYGIRCGQHGYRFVYYDNYHMLWLPEVTDETMKPRKLPGDLALSLQVEGRPVVLDDKALNFNPKQSVPNGAPVSTLGVPITSLMNQADDNTPQIMLLSDGDTNSFALALNRDKEHRSASISSADDGTIKVGDIVEIKQ